MTNIESTATGDQTRNRTQDTHSHNGPSESVKGFDLAYQLSPVEESKGLVSACKTTSAFVEQANADIDEPADVPRSSNTSSASITEGLATIRVPDQKARVPQGKSRNAQDQGDSKILSVFYNPIQQFNRDLSVLAIKAFAENLNLERKLQIEKRSLVCERPLKKGKKRKREDVNGDAIPAIAAFASDLPKQTVLDDLLEEVVPDNWEFGRQVGLKETAYPPPEVGIKRTKRYCIKSYLRKILPDHEVIRLTLWNQPVVLKGQHFEVEEASQSTTLGRLQLCSGPRAAFPLRILDALSASGLRAIRYAKEVPAVTQVIANDLSASAVSAIQSNIVSNDVAPIVGTSRANARTLMYEAAATAFGPHETLFHVIDLDPYGSAASFLDAAVQALADGGLLCITCTDAGVFASTAYLEKCLSQYGGLPVKGAFSHEAGLRIILHAIATSAARYGIAIEPLLSLSIDFYVRLFVRVRRSPAEVKFLASKTMLVFNCDHGCGAWQTQHLARSKPFENAKGETVHKHSLGMTTAAGPLCEYCGYKTHAAGPMWAGPIHNPAFVQKILDVLPGLDPGVYTTIPRIEGMLMLARDEALLCDPPSSTESDTGTPSVVVDVPANINTPFAPIPPDTISKFPFFVIPSHLARTLHTQAPSDTQFRGALRHLGYRCTGSHCKPGSIVTDAPWDVIWEIMREWAKKSEAKVDHLKVGTAGHEIWKRGMIHAGEKVSEEVEGTADRGGEQSSFDYRKGELKEIALRASDAKSLRTQLEAFLYRLDPNHPHTSADNSMSLNQARPSIDTVNSSGRSPSNPEAQTMSKNQNTAQASARDDQSPLATARRKGIIFDEKLGADPPKRGKVRYQVNPRPEWGPMSKAKMS